MTSWGMRGLQLTDKRKYMLTDSRAASRRRLIRLCETRTAHDRVVSYDVLAVYGRSVSPVCPVRPVCPGAVRGVPSAVSMILGSAWSGGARAARCAARPPPFPRVSTCPVQSRLSLSAVLEYSCATVYAVCFQTHTRDHTWSRTLRQ